MPYTEHTLKKKKTPSPALAGITNQELPLLVSKNAAMRKIVRDKIPYIKCHSQDCERYIQMTEDIAKSTVGFENQRSLIRHDCERISKLEALPSKLF